AWLLLRDAIVGSAHWMERAGSARRFRSQKNPLAASNPLEQVQALAARIVALSVILGDEAACELRRILEEELQRWWQDWPDLDEERIEERELSDTYFRLFSSRPFVLDRVVEFFRQCCDRSLVREFELGVAVDQLVRSPIVEGLAKYGEYAMPQRDELVVELFRIATIRALGWQLNFPQETLLEISSCGHCPHPIEATDAIHRIVQERLQCDSPPATETEVQPPRPPFLGLRVEAGRVIRAGYDMDFDLSTELCETLRLLIEAQDSGIAPVDLEKRLKISSDAARQRIQKLRTALIPLDMTISNPRKMARTKKVWVLTPDAGDASS
ncbi:MAG: hypothetical protein R2724_35270, partial [Bryobacterales bacterium]